MNLRRGFLAFLAVAALALASGLPARAAPPDAPWVTRDIGSPGGKGGTDVDANGVWTIKGSGIIWGNSDRFRYAYQRVPGDASISARFLDIDGANDSSRVGLMVRVNETSGSPNLNYFVQAPFGLGATTRLRSGAATGCLCLIGPGGVAEPNLWMRLQRVDNEIAGFYSRDGNLWFQAFGPVTLPTLQAEALFGLSATSVQEPDLTIGKFDQVNVQPGAVSVYGIQACGGDRAVLLQWRPLKNATAYNVYRGPKGAALDQLVKLNTDRVPGTSFTDNSAGLVNGTPLTYAVAAVLPGTDGNPVEGPRVAIPATPVAIPSGFLGCSLNEGPNSGSASFDTASGQITLRGSGFYVDPELHLDWQYADQGYFVSQLADGDVQITVKSLAGPTATNGLARAGLMIRESLDEGSRYVFLGPTSAAGLVSQRRATTNGIFNWSRAMGVAALKLPIVLRLTRRGDTITREYSTDDGKTFQAAGPPVVFSQPLAKMLHVGLIVTSDDRSEVSEAKFSGLAIQKL